MAVKVDVLCDLKHSPDTRSLNRTETRSPKRPQLQVALNDLVEGDELVVTALSRLGRDQRSVINRLHDLQDCSKEPVQAEKAGTLGYGIKQVKISSVQYEMLVELGKRWRMKPDNLIAELIEENYKSKTKR